METLSVDAHGQAGAEPVAAMTGHGALRTLTPSPTACRRHGLLLRLAAGEQYLVRFAGMFGSRMKATTDYVERLIFFLN